MSEQVEENSNDKTELEGSAKELAAYCEAEFERRRNSGEEFDEASYREAMEMTLRRLQMLEGEGYA